jgi:DNA ligase 1
MVKPWASLATQWDEVEYIHYPVMIQPKLNGTRAKWDGEQLITRQNKVWKEETLPYLFTKLRHWSKLYPGVVLDGELYSHGCPWQTLEAITAVNRQAPHEYQHMIDFHAFDIIDAEPSERRQEKLSKIYDPWVAISLVTNEGMVMTHLHDVTEAGFEGVILRMLGCPYIPGRSEALVKLKPWKYGKGQICGFKEGLGKYAGMLGAFEVSWNGIKFFVSGGLSDFQREMYWDEREQRKMTDDHIAFKYRDVSAKGIPLQPQIVTL